MQLSPAAAMSIDGNGNTLLEARSTGLICDLGPSHHRVRDRYLDVVESQESGRAHADLGDLAPGDPVFDVVDEVVKDLGVIVIEVRQACQFPFYIS